MNDLVPIEPISDPLPISEKPKRTKAPARLCTAHSTTHGGPCGANAMKGKDVCADHGGKSLSGIAHPNFKHGRYSKHLPTRLQARYEEAENDPQLLSLRRSLALLQTRLLELLERLEEQPSGRTWLQLQECLQTYDEARRDDKRLAAMSRLREIIQCGVDDAECWNEIRSILSDHGDIARKEVKMLAEKQMTVSVQESNVMLGMVAHAIITIVKDVEERKALSRMLAGMARHE